MQYGSFDDAHREYVISRPDTPLPWINYLGNESYFGLISNTGGGYSFYRDARLRRITRYRYNNVPFDYGGRYIYLRDDDSGEVWTPTWQPIRKELENYTCRHGMGYTTIKSRYNQIEAEVRFFVPIEADLEVWQLKVTNHRQDPTKISAFSCVEFCLWDAWDDVTNFQRNFNIGEVEIDEEVIYHKTEYRERRNHFAYFACSDPLAGYDTQRETFLGPYRGWDDPQVVVEGKSLNSEAHGWAPIGSHHVSLMLNPGESHQVIYVLGYHENPADQKFEDAACQRVNKRTVKPVIKKYLDPDQVEIAFRELGEFWDSLLNIIQVKTPDVNLDRMVNIWNAYQCMTTFNLSRSASFYESGVGRGLGFRDSAQDLLGFVHMIPTRARQRILDLAATQMESGGAYHQYQPLTKRGNNAVGGNFNDDPLWLVIAVAAYIKETGDWSILDEPLNYDNVPGSEKPLYDHLQRSLMYTLARIGPHGLPLIGRADWNDCLNLNTFSSEPGESFQTTTNKDGKVAESVFIAGLFILAAREMLEICRRTNHLREVDNYISEVKKMKEAVNRSGWDGEWFLRAYDDYGSKVGSKECQEGRIYIEPQGMCIMAGIGVDDDRAGRSLASVRTHLATPHGILLHQPAYTRYYLQLGEISSYPPGYKENASVFCHTNPWIIIAETILGHGDQAYDYYALLNPSAREKIGEIHRCEPYVFAQTVAGRDAATFGEAKNSWLTGTAAWTFVAATQYILGIRPTWEGLQVVPVIPQGWEGFTAQRQFRGCMYFITVERKGTGNSITLFLDGNPVEGNIIPLPKEGQKQVNVKIELL